MYCKLLLTLGRWYSIFATYSSNACALIDFLLWIVCRFLGKVISQYISECVQSGERRPDIIFNGFQYDRWKKMLKKVNVYNASILLIL